LLLFIVKARIRIDILQSMTEKIDYNYTYHESLVFFTI